MCVFVYKIPAICWNILINGVGYTPITIDAILRPIIGIVIHFPGSLTPLFILSRFNPLSGKYALMIIWNKYKDVSTAEIISAPIPTY